MNEFCVHILGCGSAMPTTRHMPSCQAIEYREKVMIMDCGEGAQLSLRRAGIKFSRIAHVFISHLHGDHVLGLPGLLSTLAMHDLGNTVHVHIFEEGARLMQDILDVMCHGSAINVAWDIVSPEGGVVYEDRSITVTAFPLRHRVPCVGYRFQEKPKLRHLRGDMVKFLDIPVARLHSIKEGADYTTPDGEVYELNLIDTPGHVDFNYEVSRSLNACDGALLIVDATQGIEAQTLANAYLAVDAGLEIVPVINKIDLPSAQVEQCRRDIEDVIGIPAEGCPAVSAKTGQNIQDVMDAIVRDIPAPRGDESKPLKALIFDSYYDSYLGVVVNIRVFDGVLKTGDRIRLMSNGALFDVVEVGTMEPFGLKPTGRLSAGEIGSHFDMTGATISYHLNVLKKADLVFEAREKNFIYYELNTSVVEEVMLWLSQLKEE